MGTNNYSRSRNPRKLIGIIIILVIAAMHAFRVGSYLNGDLYLYYYSYVSDIIIPFGLYFLLCITEIRYKFLQKWTIKAGIIFGAATLTEILQAFGIYFLGETFDYIDFAMFGLGVLMAVLFDKLIFEPFVPNWKLDK